MDDQTTPPRSGHHLATRLSHAGRGGSRDLGLVNPPLHRGSTVLFPNSEALHESGRYRLDQTLVYGVLGNPTHHALEDLVAEIEGGTRCQIVSSGLAAITTPLLAYLKSGEHCLLPDSVYGPARRFCNTLLRDLGVETTYYPPDLDEPALNALIRSNTRVVYAESPGSHTFEVQDVPMIARVAHARGAKVLMDNTWGVCTFQPFTHGVDVSIQALTKYVVGHSDVLLGAIITNTQEDWKRVRTTALALGQYASPDDCWLALRGARTLDVRLRAQMDSALRVAGWLAQRPEVNEVLHPALPGARGHEIWKRDFTGACSLFGVVFQPDFTINDVTAMLDGLRLFGIGESWGGFESLAIRTTGAITRSKDADGFGGPAIRIHVGLESPEDLIADLAQALPLLHDAEHGSGSVTK